MIKITFRVNPATIEAMRTKGPSIIKILTTKISILMQQLSSYVAVEKLSGQIVTPRSGRLRGSVHALPTEILGTKIIGAVEAGSGPAFYASGLEYGGRSAFEIIATKKRALAFIADGKQVFAKRVQHPAQIARPFMRPSQEENRARILEELNDAVNRVVHGE
jgi:hypothetical protein